MNFRRLGYCSDHQMVSVIMRNLLSNAIKFSYHNESIVTGASIIEENLRTFVQISIRNKRQSIQAEQRDVFFAMQNTSSTPGTNGETGTGLGLLICSDFTEKLGSRIWLDESSEETIIHFTLPTFEA